MIFNLNDKNCELPTRETNPEAWKILVEHVGLHASYDEIFNGETTMTVNQVLEELICERDLPTEGGAWDAMLEHVKENAMTRDLYLGDLEDDTIIEEVQNRGIPLNDIYDDLSVADVFDDETIVEYIRDMGIPPNVVYDEDAILDCECVKSLLEIAKIKTEEWEATAGALYKQRIAKLELENAELAEENEDYLAQVYQDGWKKGWAGEDICEGRYGTFGGCDGLDEAEARVAELEEKLAVSNRALECLGIACEEAQCCGGTKQWGRGRWPCDGCEDCDPECVSEEE